MASYDCVEDLTRRMIFARAADIRPMPLGPAWGDDRLMAPAMGDDAVEVQRFGSI